MRQQCSRCVSDHESNVWHQWDTALLSFHTLPAWTKRWRTSMCVPTKICQIIFIAGLLNSSIHDVLWTKYAYEEFENYRTNYTENIKSNWFIDHSCYNDIIKRIDYGNYLHKIFCWNRNSSLSRELNTIRAYLTSRLDAVIYRHPISSSVKE